MSSYQPYFSAEIYKTYLHCASKIIRDEEGAITAFDGDRIMAVFIGGSKNTSAAKCALRINRAVVEIINPAIKAQYANSRNSVNAKYTLKHGVGVDTSELFITRTGIRGSNDLVWVGRAANYAAKLCALREENYASYITADVYNNMNDEIKFYDGRTVWENRFWTEKKITVYRSSWTWTI